MGSGERRRVSDFQKTCSSRKELASRATHLPSKEENVNRVHKLNLILHHLDPGSVGVLPED